MVDQYWREIEDVENDIENAMQISSILLKLKGYDDDLEKIDTNTGSISTNLEKINDNENSISNNLKNIDNVTNFISKSEKYFEKKYFIQKQVFKFNKENNFFTIFEEEIEYDFIKNTLLFVQNNTYYNYEDLSDDHHRAQHEYNIYDDENNLIHKYLFNKDTYYDKSLDPILYTNEDFCICFKKNYKKIKINLQLHRHNRHGYGSFNMEIDENNDNYINITCTDDQKAADISDNSTSIETNTSSISSNKGLIETNTSDISSNKSLIETNTSSISSNKGLIETNTSDISDNSDKIGINTGSIASNLLMINNNKDDIIALQTSNVKAFYNLNQIFIYDIEKGNQTVNKDNHFHIFEKEITYNFTKNSYLEIILKVLTEISNYVLIGFFQILCNFYDQDDNLFYTISLSTAMGSINKLSTIKSVFIVPINENMSKIKIDFFIAPKETQQNRSAKFITQDINSNKIYVKYFQKTEEMSIKDIQDSLDNVKDINLEQINTNKSEIASNINTVNNISSDLEKINKNLSSTLVNILKKVFIYDIELSYKELKFNYINKSYSIFSKEIEFNFKAFNYIEIYSEILFDYINDYNIGSLKTEYIFYDDRNIQIEKFEKYQTNSGKNLNNYLITKDYMLFINESNNTKLKLDIYVSLIEDIDDKFWNITLNIINNYKNKVYIKYYENKINS